MTCYAFVLSNLFQNRIWRALMKITKLLIMPMVVASIVFAPSCTTNPGTVEAINSASFDRRNIIGIEISNLTTAQRAVTGFRREGVYISAVIPGHPASIAGVQPGDIILRINSSPVYNVSDALTIINDLEGGRKYPFEIYRSLGKHGLKHIIAHILVEKIQEQAIGRIS